MIFHLHLPCFPLNQFIESFIYYRGFQPSHSIDRFLPDGNIHLVFDLKEAPQHIYDNQTLKVIQSCERVWFSGIRNKFLTIPSGRDSEMFIINFRKGKAYPFTRVPIHEFTDHVVDGEKVLGNRILELREKLISTLEPLHKFTYAEQFLLKHFRQKLVDSPCIDFAIQSIVKFPDIATIGTIASQTGYSQRHFISMFREQVGVVPKSFLKISRFQKAIQEIENRREIRWSEIAQESGYYDQAHFINDFKVFSGYTPGQYLQNKTDQLNYVPVN